MMPQRPSPATRTTLYRLDDVADLVDAIRDKYLETDQFTTTPTTVNGKEALLVSGAMTTETVPWARILWGLTSVSLDLGNVTAAAALIIRGSNKNAWALTYGMGFQLLDQMKVDGGFGQRIAIRVADPEELSSVTRTVLDQRSRTDRSSIPSGDHLRGFGVGDFGELVTRLVGKAEISSLVGGSKPIRIRGADALSIPLGKRPDHLLADLEELEKILAMPPVADLEILEQLVEIKHDAELVAELDKSLSAALADPDNTRLGLSWPHERIDENGTPSSFHISGAGRRNPQVDDGVPELAVLLDAIGGGQDPLDRLRKIKIQLYRDDAGTDSISADIPGIQWLAFETEKDGKRYCLHNGRWYLMDQQYAEKLANQAKAIFDRQSPIQLPAWPAGCNEDGYNKLAATQIGGTVLDKKLIHTSFHRRGIEACDILAADGALIHVKSLEKSASASHLIAQALVSTDALLYDEEARVKFRERAIAAGATPERIPDPVRTVVLGLARPNHLVTANDLFTFTQVTLVRSVTQLERRGVSVFIGPIVRNEPAEPVG